MVAAHASHSSSSGEWIACLDKRPLERSSEDVDIIFARLKEVKAFEKFHPNLLQQICLCGYYENLEKGITLFRQGDIGTNWYAVLTGSLDVKVSDTSNHQDFNRDRRRYLGPHKASLSHWFAKILSACKAVFCHERAALEHRASPGAGSVQCCNGRFVNRVRLFDIHTCLKSLARENFAVTVSFVPPSW